MKYLVIEVHPGYAVLLDSEGRFLRAANLGYQVGETVTEIVVMKEHSREPFFRNRKLIGGIAAAACFCLVSVGLYFGMYVPDYTAYGTLAMEINPGVQMTLSRSGRVLELHATNDDGERLVEDLAYKHRSEQVVADELADRAVELGFLSEGGEIVLEAAAEDEDWTEETEKEAVRTLQEHMEAQNLEVQVLTREEKERKEETEEEIQVVITLPATPTPTATSTPTEAPEQTPTAAPTQAPTAAPTQAPTTAPTQAPTEAPTQAPTAAPTQAPAAVPDDDGRSDYEVPDPEGDSGYSDNDSDDDDNDDDGSDDDD